MLIFLNVFLLVHFTMLSLHKKNKDMTSNTKEWIQYGTAIGMLVSGVLLTFLCFFLNRYKIETEVLWYVAQCITFAGAVFGISAYTKQRLDKIEKEIKGKININDEL